ncbi:MAG: magnesium transporter [Candidatus Omnitrophica bacterium]|nr:magnesium transporter [Candidatus Omnitrophota bacterium]
MAEESFVPLIQKYFESDPVTAAHHLETLDEDQAVDVLKSLSPSLCARVVLYLPDAFAASLLQKVPTEFFKEIVDHLESQDGASLFLHLPPETRSLFLEYLSDQKKKEISEFLTYPENSAGRIMSTDFLAFHGDLKIKDVVHKLRQMIQKGSRASYVYVVDSQNQLVGVMNMRDMLIADDDAALDSVMRREVFTVNCFMDREQVANELSNRHYISAPVVDHENRLLGIVKADQLIEDVQEEATEDLQKMFGAGGDERVFSPIRFSLKTRLPWLHINLATAFLAGSVVAFFQDFIGKFPVLAVYLPVVAGQGGNTGAQSLAVVIRGIVLREIPAKKVSRLIFKEAWIGAVNGFVIGIVTALAAWLWQGNPFLGLVVGLAMFCNMMLAGLFGAAIPITMKAIGLDPAQCSNIILTTITDVIGFLCFLGFAYLFQNYLH